ncbi:uncharacterized protein K02A2.6-like isoform X1 [Aedes albopictus]|uniref:RNA-directed DNA polymerase n=1 Tax=Aedes albopictus TaxID=7160 RepID=A0ABM1ZYT3_AEDAL
MDKWDIPQFKFRSLPNNVIRDEWQKYKRNFGYIAAANGEKDKTRLKNIFLARAGPDVQDVFSSLPGADVEEDEHNAIDPYKTAIEKLDEYFSPKHHAAFERNSYWTLKPMDDESMEKFLWRSLEVARKCDFGSTSEESRNIAVIDKVILFAPSELKEKLLQKETLTLDEVARMVSSYEAVKYQSSQMRGAPNTDRPSTYWGGSSSEVCKIQGPSKNPTGECFRCGRKNHYGNDPKCPARNQKCNKCSKIGHFAKRCRTTLFSQKRKADNPVEWKGKKPRPQNVSRVHDDEKENPATTSFIFSIGNGEEFIWVNVGGVLIQMMIDSGSAKNILDDQTWERMKTHGVEVEKFTTEVDQTFRAYGRDSKPLVVGLYYQNLYTHSKLFTSFILLSLDGMFDAIVSVEGVSSRVERNDTFYIVKGGSQPLLGRLTATKLGVLSMGLPSGISMVNNVSDEKRPFPKIKGVKLRIPIDKTVTPVVQHVRRPPIALLGRIEDKLSTLLKSDIIEPVSEASEWVSPLVTIVKDNGDLRLCVDMRRANQAIRREHHMMPTIEDFLPRLKTAKFFSRLDIKESYYQVELEEDSRYITTFICHKGLFRFKRLMFGISCAPEMFQKVLEQILAECENTINYIDDIIIFGKTDEEHDQALQRVLTTLKERGILLNHAKCIFKAKELDFLGHVISEDGIRPTAGKIEALEKFRAPTTAEETRSFLGLVTYVGRFLPDLATATAPLRELIQSGKHFVWQERHQKAFEQLKLMITNIQTLHFFDNSLRTRVVTDASPVALGAVLLQFESGSDDDPHVICYVSKSLTPTEKRYCQTEREALAIVWAVERLSVYLLGRKFELETDHKPLEAIFAPTSRPCARIERWVLRLQSFTFEVKYRKGSNNIADPLSRMVVEDDAEEFEKDNKFLILAITESAAVDVGEIEDAARMDGQLQLVVEALQTGVWNRKEIKDFEPFRDELGLVEDLLVRGNKLVVPEQLRKRMLELAHEGHPGESLMKRRLRDRVWWPKMDGEVTSCVKTCDGCRLVGLPSKPVPMTRRAMPTKPWVDVAIDFMGPLPSNEYLLVIIDYFSRYKEVEIMVKITAKETVNRLDKIFTRLGYPRTITLDNAKQFIGREFEQYCTIHGITLNHSTPYWPQENGLVERQNRSLLKRLQISHALERDWKQDLQDYLVMYYTTPHSSTGKTPTELCFGRTIRSKLPSLGDIETAPVNTDYRDRDQALKSRQKQSEDVRRRAKESSVQIGDTVLMENLVPGNKLTTKFNPTKFKVVNRSGARVTIEDHETGKVFDRNVSHVKKVGDVSDGVAEDQDKIEQPLVESDSDEDKMGFKGFDLEEQQEQDTAVLGREFSDRERRLRRVPDRYRDFVL